MRTIFVKDLVRKVTRGKDPDVRQLIPALLFLGAMFLLGRAAAETLGEIREAAGQAIPGIVSESENWGLGFGKEGQKPTGNATSAELGEYNAYYMADGDEKVIYLTFDCGYENGNTEPILDALKAHQAPATFFVVGHYLESAPELVKRMVEDI